MGLRFKEKKLPKDPEERFKYLYKLQEQLRLFHNNKAKQMKKGEITIAKFRSFQQGWFAKRNLLICSEINSCKNGLSKEDREKLIEYDEETKGYNGKVKEKETYKKLEATKVDITDIEDDQGENEE